jgi:polyisoprenoid-binding protein YceI
LDLKLYTPVVALVSVLVLVSGAPYVEAQSNPTPAAAAATGVKLDVTDGSQVRYRVREQLVGISFPNDAVGSTSGLKGALVFRPDGTIDPTRSKLTVDLTTLKSDQEMRDGYVQRRVLETEKFPTAEFVPRRAEGAPFPLPTAPGSQAGFKLIGDMTIHGVTKEVVWTVVATFSETKVAGLATTSFPFAQFGLTKPSIARLMSVDDTIQLEIDFKTLKSGL